MDQNRAADEAFQALHKPAHISSTSNSSNPSKTPSFVRGTFPSRFVHSTPTPGNPVPMDINATRKAKALPDICRRCGKTGYWVKDCDHRFNVRFMDDGEIQ